MRPQADGRLRMALGVLVSLTPIGLMLVASSVPGSAQETLRNSRRIEFNRDVKPILSENCFACHGADAGTRVAGLRLDQAKGATEPLPSGRRAVVPGNLQASELYRRVLADDARVMPPHSTGKRLTKAQIETLRRWIEQGAEYQDHWSYLPPTRPQVPPAPAGSFARWPINAIDRFIFAKLQQERVRPSPEADRATLIRRLSLDLTGLPPTPEQVSAFVNDRSPEAYQKVVDRLLNSPHYGERMAVYWLDLVRYADTDGYHGDRHRNVWPYRDYVINAFNQNKPFDQFTIEQIAGDLLPNATLEQKVASGYNRLNMITREGGAQAKEYLAKYGADRVRTTSLVWLGSTLGCAECHDHKYDPFTAKDFYQFKAFFADIQQVGLYPNNKEDLDPTLLMPTPDQTEQLKKLDAEIAALKAEMQAPLPNLKEAVEKWAAQIQQDAKARGALPRPIQNILAVEPGKRNAKQQQSLEEHYRAEVAPELAEPRGKLKDAERRLAELDRNIARTLVTVSGKPEVTRVLARGNWMDDTGEVVSPNVPHFLPPLNVGERASRLDLARWLVSRKNPLTARVLVNRLWMLFLGTGLVRTPGDFGAQGAVPTHPELLDWLAVELMDSGWDVKHVVRHIVMSRAYRQVSAPSRDLRERDPYNLLFARQGQFRLDAEFVRDNALAISGLLAPKVGGRSTRPYQPDGYWDHCNTFAGKLIYEQDHGIELYRRGLYTYWKRSFLHPAMLAFDAPSREECTVERPRSNTPLQALVLLNDPTYVEAARVLAERAWREGGNTLDARIAWAFRKAVARTPSPRELRLLSDLFQRHQAQYARDEQAARDLLAVGEAPTPKDIAAVDLAAATAVTRAILNLHETITRN